MRRPDGRPNMPAVKQSTIIKHLREILQLNTYNFRAPFSWRATRKRLTSWSSKRTGPVVVRLPNACISCNQCGAKTIVSTINCSLRFRIYNVRTYIYLIMLAALKSMQRRHNATTCRHLIFVQILSLLMIRFYAIYLLKSLHSRLELSQHHHQYRYFCNLHN